MTRARDAADQINRVNSSAADATAITISALENVGIGTSSPDNVGSTTALTINRASGNGQLSLMGNGTVYGRIFADNATGDLKMGNPTSNDVMFYTANAERMRIDSSGRVGINYTNMGLANAYGDGLVVSKSTIAGSSGISVIAATNGYSSLYLGDSVDTFVGGLEYNHNNDSMGIYANNKRVISVAPGGEVTMQYQPAFLVKKVTTQSDISINTTHTVTYQTEIFDQGGDFASNTFTAPVTGKYQFNVNIRIANIDISADYYHVHVRTSNLAWPVTLQAPEFTSDPAYWSFNASILADMDAGDTAYVSVYQNNGAAQADIQGSDDNNFSGYLVA